LSPTTIFSAQLPGTAIGTLRVWASGSGVRRVEFESDPIMPRPEEELSTASPPAHLPAALRALSAYLAGGRAAFSVPLDLTGVTPFQRRVFERLLGIPYGQVVTYGRIAEDIGARTDAGGALVAARAVGQAVGANPIPIFIPCHRVVGADGRLTGFGGGPRRKAVLLAIEGIDVDGELASSRVRPEVLRLPL
jgi:methylated-DNA-[protein]-cysteine S-methyltransferase